MTVVIDANLVVALVLPLPYSAQATHKMSRWQSAGTELSAPALLAYEAVTALRKAVLAGMLSPEEAITAITHIQTLPIEIIAPNVFLNQSALAWADRLGQSAAYDAQYLAVAEWLRAELWTADRRLVASAQQAGAIWVRWIGTNLD